MSDVLIPPGIPPENITVTPYELHMEVFDMGTSSVWLCQQPITRQEYQAMVPEAPFVKSGIGAASTNFAYFLRSPGATEDGPLTTRVIGGYTFAYVAKPLNFRGWSTTDVPIRLTIEKYHVLGYDAGRRVDMVRLPDGSVFVQQIEAIGDEKIPLPADWEPFQIELEAPWRCDMGCPVEVFFFRNLRSFMGPVPPEQMPAGKRMT